MIQRFININGASIFLDNAYFNRGVFHVEPNTLGEQCEDCGQDIVRGLRLRHPLSGAVMKSVPEPKTWTTFQGVITVEGVNVPVTLRMFTQGVIFQMGVKAVSQRAGRAVTLYGDLVASVPRDVAAAVRANRLARRGAPR